MVDEKQTKERFGGEVFVFPANVRVNLLDPREGPAAQWVAGCVLAKESVIFFDEGLEEVLRMARSALTGDGRKIIPVAYSGDSSLEISLKGSLTLEFRESQPSGFTSADGVADFHGWLRKQGILR